jgi:uncharacterized protein YyaL (SSP411 family)
MLPYPVSRRAYWDPEMAKILAKFRGDTPKLAKLAGTGCLDVNGTTAARLIRCARLWGDQARLNRILDLADRLDQFRTGSDVVHVTSSNKPGTYLGDYLAYADVCMQEYLATTRVPAFEQGLGVLMRATELFRGPHPGCYLLSPHSTDPLLPQDIDVPEIVDDVRESCTSQMIRLLCDYGRLLGPKNGGQKLLDLASDTVAHFAGLHGPGSVRFAGYYLASAGFSNLQCAFTVGPKSQDLADELARMRPNRLVSPAEGPVRTDLSGKTPGVYVVTGGVTAGPYSVSEAARLMPQYLQPGAG